MLNEEQKYDIKKNSNLIVTKILRKFLNKIDNADEAKEAKSIIIHKAAIKLDRMIKPIGLLKK